MTKICVALSEGQGQYNEHVMHFLWPYADCQWISDGTGSFGFVYVYLFVLLFRAIATSLFRQWLISLAENGTKPGIATLPPGLSYFWEDTDLLTDFSESVANEAIWTQIAKLRRRCPLWPDIRRHDNNLLVLFQSLDLGQPVGLLSFKLGVLL